MSKQNSANYRDYMQNYALEAIKATILVNGAAIAFIVSELSSLSKVIPVPAIKVSVLGYVIALVLSLCAAILAFSSARMRARHDEDMDVPKPISDAKQNYKRNSTRLTNTAVGFVVFSVFLFCFSSSLMVWQIRPDQAHFGGAN